MDKLELFYLNVIDLLNYCAVQEFISEDEEDYIAGKITEIKDQIKNGNIDRLIIQPSDNT